MKKIGLQVDLNEDHSKPLFNYEYYLFCKRYGECVELIHPYDTELYKLDLLVLIGGRDLAPAARYGEVMDPRICGRPNYDLEYFDQTMLLKYIQQGTPCFGLCRGMQSLNCTAAFGDRGGSLWQHVDEPTSQHGEIVHLGEDVITGEFMGICSRHHQAVKELHPKYQVSLQGFTLKKKQRIELQIEGIRGVDEYRKCAGVQFHPESMMEDEHQEAILWVDKEVERIMNIN